MDSNRVRGKKNQRSIIENNIDEIWKELQGRILWRKKIYPPKKYKHISEIHQKWPV